MNMYGEDGVLFEYEGTVTQLGATSEVATIGFLFTVLAGEQSKIHETFITMGDQAAGENIFSQKRVVAGNQLRQLVADSIDNTSVQNSVGVIESANAVALGTGDSLTNLLGGGQSLRIFSDSTIDATTTIVVRMLYTSKGQKMTVAPVGAGIAITAEVHKSV